MISSPTILEVCTLGRFEIRHQQNLLGGGNWKRRKVCDLFKLLLSVEQHRLHREQIQETLWPASTNEQAANSFSKTLYLLRRALEPNLAKGKGSASAYVALDHDTLLLLPDSLRIDADTFETSAKQLQTRLRSRAVKEQNAQSRSAFLDEFDTVLSLYAGEYLPEDIYEDWAQRRRDRLHRTHSWLLENAAELALANMMGQRACEYLQALLEHNSTDEQVHSQLMLVYARLGRRSEALNQFQLLRTALKEELNAEPLPQTTELFRAIQAGRVLVDLVEAHDRAAIELPADANAGGHHLHAATEISEMHPWPRSQTLSAGIEQEVQRDQDPLPRSRITPDRISHTELVGREEELRQLHSAYIQACHGQQRVCFVSGEPGIGKTRLAREFMRWLEETQQARVLWGYSLEVDCLLPYQPIVDAITPHVRTCSPKQLRSMLGRSAADLAKIIPEIRVKLSDLARPESLGPEMECHNLYNAVARYFNALASERPLVIILDDMQKVDTATLQLLGYLTLQGFAPFKKGGAVPLFLLLYSDDEVHEAHPLHGFLTSLTRLGNAQEIQLKRLDEESVQRFLANMAGHPVGTAFAGEIYNYTEGNPFFISEVLRSLLQEEKIRQVSEQWQTTVELDALALPHSVRLLIEQRLAHLTPECRATLASAAILGRQFSSVLLCQVCNLSEDVVAEHMDAALQSQILMPLANIASSSSNRGYYGQDYDMAFSHDKFREMLAQRLNPLRRRAIHRKVAQAIETRYSGHPARLQPYYSRLAHHHQLAENWDQAVDYFLKAARYATSVYAFIDAARFMENALALLMNEEGQLSRAELLRQLADIYLYIGRPDKAIEAGMASSALWRSFDNKVKEAEASLAVAFSFHWQGRELNALNYINHALECLEEVPEEPALLAKAYVQWGMAATIMGDTTAAQEKLQRADELHAQAGGKNPFISVVSLWARSWNAFLAASPRHMLEYALRGAEVCRATHSFGWEPMLTYSAAWAQMLLGRIAEGEQTARDALEKAQRFNAVGAQGWANLALAFLAIQQGRWNEAEQFGNMALAIAATLRDADLQSRVLWSRSVCAGWQEDWGLAIKNATEALQVARRENETSMVYPHLLVQAAKSYFYKGKMEVAHLHLDHAMQLAQERQYQQLPAIGHRLRGRILQAEGKLDEARDSFEQSLAALIALDDVVEYARTQEAYAELYLAQRNATTKERAQALIESAQTTFKRLGMKG